MPPPQGLGFISTGGAHLFIHSFYWFVFMHQFVPFLCSKYWGQHVRCLCLRLPREILTWPLVLANLLISMLLCLGCFSNEVCFSPFVHLSVSVSLSLLGSCASAQPCKLNFISVSCSLLVTAFTVHDTRNQFTGRNHFKGVYMQLNINQITPLI